MPLQHIYLVTKRIHAITTYLFGYEENTCHYNHILFGYEENTCHCNISIWLLREYMPLQHIYLVTKRIHAIATYLFGY